MHRTSDVYRPHVANTRKHTRIVHFTVVRGSTEENGTGGGNRQDEEGNSQDGGGGVLRRLESRITKPGSCWDNFSPGKKWIRIDEQTKRNKSKCQICFHDGGVKGYRCCRGSRGMGGRSMSGDLGVKRIRGGTQGPRDVGGPGRWLNVREFALSKHGNNKTIWFNPFCDFEFHENKNLIQVFEYNRTLLLNLTNGSNATLWDCPLECYLDSTNSQSNYRSPWTTNQIHVRPY